jgi:hypothetical protein
MAPSTVCDNCKSRDAALTNFFIGATVYRALCRDCARTLMLSFYSQPGIDLKGQTPETVVEVMLGFVGRSDGPAA